MALSKDDLNPRDDVAADAVARQTEPSNPDNKLSHVPSDVDAKIRKARDEAARKAFEDNKEGPEVARAARKAALAELRKHEDKMAPGVGIPKATV